MTAAHLDDPGEDVGQREEQQRGGALAEQLVELLDRDPQLEHEVAVREHAALGATRGAGGVEQGGQVEGCRGRTTTLQLLVGDVGTEPGQDVDRVVLERPDVVEVVELAAHLGDPGQVHGPLGDDGAGARVARGSSETCSADEVS